VVAPRGSNGWTASPLSAWSFLLPHLSSTERTFHVQRKEKCPSWTKCLGHPLASPLTKKLALPLPMIVTDRQCQLTSKLKSCFLIVFCYDIHYLHGICFATHRRRFGVGFKDCEHFLLSPFVRLFINPLLIAILSPLNHTRPKPFLFFLSYNFNFQNIEKNGHTLWPMVVSYTKFSRLSRPSRW